MTTTPIPAGYEKSHLPVPRHRLTASRKNYLENRLAEEHVTHILTGKGEPKKWMGWCNPTTIPVQKGSHIERIPYGRVACFLRETAMGKGTSC